MKYLYVCIYPNMLNCDDDSMIWTTKYSFLLFSSTKVTIPIHRVAKTTNNIAIFHSKCPNASRRLNQLHRYLWYAVYLLAHIGSQEKWNLKKHCRKLQKKLKVKKYSMYSLNNFCIKYLHKQFILLQFWNIWVCFHIRILNTWKLIWLCANIQ